MNVLNSIYKLSDAVGSTTISPNRIPDIYLWLDANDTSKFTVGSDGTIVWNDKSVNSDNILNLNNASSSNNSTIVLSSVNSNKSVYFPIGQSLVINNLVFDNFPFTYFAVFNFSGGLSTTDTNTLLAAVNPPNQNGILYQQFDDTDYRIAYGTTGGDSNCIVVSNAFDNSGLTLITFQIISANNVLLNINGDSSIQTSNLLNTPLHTDGISSSSIIQSMLGMYVSEMILYRSNLSIFNYKKIEGYLAWKWKINSKLPSSHLFFNDIPIDYTFSGLNRFPIPRSSYGKITGISINDYGFMIMTSETKGIFYSRTYGSKWTLSDANVSYNWRNCSINNNCIAFACTINSVYYSTNGGINWILTNAPNPNDPITDTTYTYQHISVNNNNYVVVATSNINNLTIGPNFIYRYSPIDVSWKKSTSFPRRFLQISLADNGYGIVSGNQYQGITSDLSNNIWSQLSGGGSGKIPWSYGSSISSSGNYIVGNGGAGANPYIAPSYRYSTDNGINFQIILVPDQRPKLLVGNNGTVLSTVDTRIFVMKIAGNQILTTLNYTFDTLNPNVIGITPSGLVGVFPVVINSEPILVITNL